MFASEYGSRPLNARIACKRKPEHRLAKTRRRTLEQILREEPIEIVRIEPGGHVGAATHRGQPDDRGPPARLGQELIGSLTAENGAGLVVRERERVHLDDRDLAVHDPPGGEPRRPLSRGDQ
jgi:hypothetical protein